MKHVLPYSHQFQAKSGTPLTAQSSQQKGIKVLHLQHSTTGPQQVFSYLILKSYKQFTISVHQFQNRHLDINTSPFNRVMKIQQCLTCCYYHQTVAVHTVLAFLHFRLNLQGSAAFNQKENAQETISCTVISSTPCQTGSCILPLGVHAHTNTLALKRTRARVQYLW